MPGAQGQLLLDGRPPSPEGSERASKLRKLGCQLMPSCKHSLPWLKKEGSGKPLNFIPESAGECWQAWRYLVLGWVPFRDGIQGCRGPLGLSDKLT